MKPIITLAGRPNAGKSTLFNRLTKSKDAIVDDIPGVTRDRLYRPARWDDKEFILVDTGGFAGKKEDPFSSVIQEQILAAVRESSALIVLFDGREGITPYDREMVDLFRDLEIPVFYAVNKIDHEGKEAEWQEFFSLGIDPIFPISAAHGYGISALMDSLVSTLPDTGPEPEPDAIRVALVGRPNVGKSSIVNRILGENRMIVSDIPGTTRDSIDTRCRVNGMDFILIDTAGIRRKAKVKKKLEKVSVIKAIKSIARCDVAVIVTDAVEGLTDQDIKVAGAVFTQGKGAVFAFNKWDLVSDPARKAKNLRDSLEVKAKFLRFAPHILVSAKTGKNLHKLFGRVNEVYKQYKTRIPTGPLNRIVADATAKTEPSLYHGRRIKFYYATQVSACPPTFVFFTNYPEGVHFSYQRYLTNQIREAAGLDKTPIRILLRKRGEN